MSKPLELHIYPKVDRWVEYTMEFLGKAVSGSSREYGYETPRGIFEGDEWPEKRLTDAELAAEYFAQDSQCRHEQWIETVRGDEDYTSAERAGQSRMYDRLNTLHRFATLPHYDECP